MTTIKRHLFLPFLGLFAGAVSAFLGVGGGVIIVPLLMWGLRVPLKQATGVSLASVVFISTVGTVAELFVHASNVRWVTALWLTGGSLIGSWLGGRLLRRLDERPLQVGFAAILILSTWRLLTTTGAGVRVLESATVPNAALAVVVLVGLMAGAASVLFGVGGGVVVVPAFLLLTPEVPFPAVAATSLASVVPTAAFSAYQHLRLGTVDGSLVRRLSTFGVMGAVLGTLAVNAVPSGPFRVICAAFLVLAAAAMVVNLKKVGPEGPALRGRWPATGALPGNTLLPVPVRVVAPTPMSRGSRPRGVVRSDGER